MTASYSVAQAKEVLFEAYCVELKRAYRSGDQAVRQRINGTLERLLEHVDPVRREQFIKKSPFNGERAREVREKAGLSRVALKKIVGIHEMTIFKYETGKCIVDPRSKSSKEGTYLQWLKKQGYDPFKEGKE